MAIKLGYVNERDDMIALSVIFWAVPPDMVSVLTVKGMAMEAWDTTKIKWMGFNCVRKANA